MTVQIENRRIDGPHGEIPLRIYTPEPAPGERLGLVWAHGGGWVAGDLDMPESDWVARQLAERGITVIAVDYRLAPPIPNYPGLPEVADPLHYPAASEEVTAAFTWATESDLAVPPQNWAIGGASAGANLTAGATLRLRDDGGPRPCGLLLVYGLLHGELPPMRPELAAKYEALEQAGPAIGPEAVKLMTEHYVGDPALLKESYAFPGGHDLQGTPPTFLLNSELDALRASGERFGAELAAAGVDLVMIREDGVGHGHLSEPDNPGAARSLARMADWLASPSLLGTAHER